MSTEPLDTHGARATDAGVPTPPPAPVPGRKAAASADDTGAAGQKRGARTVVVALLAAVSLVCVVLAALVATGVVTFGASDDSVDPAASNAIDSSSSTASTQQSAEAKEAQEAIEEALEDLRTDRDGIFTGYVQTFIDAYDAGVAEGEGYTLTDLGITAADLAPHLRSGFECEIENVDVYNGIAWVNVQVTSKNMASAANVFANEVALSAADYSSETAYKQHLREEFLASYDGLSTRTVSALLTVQRGDDGSWELADDDYATLLGAAWYTA